MAIRNRFAELHDEITGWRRHIHANPELLYETHETAAFVADRLREFGVDEVVTGIGQTGVVGVIRGRANGSGKVVALRADMDALPIEEATGLDYASNNPGKMHACGHDGHTAMLLGAAKYLAETRNFDGTCIVIFQPAEEGGAGAKAMLDDGLVDRFGIQEFYGMHNWPGQDSGKFAIRPGAFFAAADRFKITVTGKGGHAAMPQKAVDTVVIASAIVMALQTVVSRSTNPVDQAVVSVTNIDTGDSAFNVLPHSAEMIGTVRTLSEEVRDATEARMAQIVENTARAYGGEAAFEFIRGYPVMVNAEEPTDFAASVAETVTGQCDDAPLVMGAEDFAFMLNARPGAYILMGNGDTAPVHHPEYNFDDAAIPAGCSWLSEIIEQRMPA